MQPIQIGWDFVTRTFGSAEELIAFSRRCKESNDPFESKFASEGFNAGDLFEGYDFGMAAYNAASEATSYDMISEPPDFRVAITACDEDAIRRSFAKFKQCTVGIMIVHPFVDGEADRQTMQSHPLPSTDS